MYAASFINELKGRIDSNIKMTPGFGAEFKKTFSCNCAEELSTTGYNDFVSLGLAKYVSAILRDHTYRITECDAVWLIRDTVLPTRGLLHLAFIVQRPPTPSPAKKLGEIGKREYPHEKEVVRFVKKHRGHIRSIRESTDKVQYAAEHGEDILRLGGENFEVTAPEPEQ